MVVAVLPDRSLEQRMAALKRGNGYRIARADLKHEVKALGRAEGSMLIAEHLEAPPEWLASMKVYELLKAVPGWGERHVREALRREQVSPVKTVAGLSPRQRRALVFAVEAWSRR